MSDIYRLPKSGSMRYPAGFPGGGTSSAQASFSLNAGHNAASTLRTTAGISQWPIISMDRAQGLRITFAGTGADNDTFDYRIWLVNNTFEGVGAGQFDFDLQLFGTGSATLGAGTAPGGGTPISASDRTVDTLTFAIATSATNPKGLGGTIETAFGSAGAAAYSPAGDLEAALVIPHLGWTGGVLIEFDLTGTSTAAWAYVTRT